MKFDQSTNLQELTAKKKRVDWIVVITLVWGSFLPLTPLSAALLADNSRSDTLDILNYTINLDITDFTNRRISGNCVITLTPKLNNVNELNLDLLLLTIDSIKVDNQPASFAYNDTLAKIVLSPALNTGDTVQVIVYYQGVPQIDPSAYGGGFYFNSGYAYNVGVGFAVDPHVFGRAWFPCFDNFVERSTYDFNITTDTIKKAFCNGLLQGVTDNGNGTSTWQWKMAQSIPTYLASVAVANYASVNMSYNGLNGPIPIILNAVAGDTTKMKNTFANLPKAIEAFEKYYGPHRFDRIGYNLLPVIGGAIEHATNIGFWRSLVDGTLTYESLVAHELSHHWWGDLATCETAEEMWLNEGWASYSENIFFEHTYGKDRYRQEVRDNHEYVLHYAHVNDSGYRAVSGVPHAYTYGTTVYQKGADVIHSLRGYMGDSLFFNCLSSFLNAHAFKSMNTYQLRDYLSTCSGIDLTAYFDNWILVPGFPHFSIDSFKVSTDTDGDHIARVFVRQRLHQAPNLYSNVPLEITFYDSNWNKQTEKVKMNGECTEFVFRYGGFYDPVFAAIDLDEKLSDAITDEYQVIRTTGTKNFGTAKMNIIVTSITDSALVRVEHNWIAPDRMKTPIMGLYLSKERYWKVDGFNFSNMKANATINYNGKSATGGYLDNDLLVNVKEDSLVLMHRPSPAADWAIADSFKLTIGSVTDRYGTITIYNLQPGEYAFAIYDASRNDTTVTLPPANCNTVTHAPLPGTLGSNSGIVLYPNPSDRLVRIESGDLLKGSIMIFNLDGRIIRQFPLAANNKYIEIHTQDWLPGIYIVRIRQDNLTESRKLIIIH